MKRQSALLGIVSVIACVQLIFIVLHRFSEREFGPQVFAYNLVPELADFYRSGTFALRNRTDPKCFHQFAYQQLSLILCSAFVDPRPLLHEQKPYISVNGYSRKNQLAPEMQCKLASGALIPAKATSFKELGYWVAVQYTCALQPWQYLEEKVALVEDIDSPSESAVQWITLNSFPEQEIARTPVSSLAPIAVCVKPFVSSYKSFDEGMVEWIEYYASMGVSKIIIYDRTSSPQSAAILNEYQNLVPGLIDVIPWKLPECSKIRKLEKGTDQYCAYDNRYVGFNGQLASNQDCLARLGGWAHYIISVDLDELIVPRSKTYDSFHSLISSIVNPLPLARFQLAALHFFNYFYHDCSIGRPSSNLDRSQYPASRYWFLSARSRDLGTSGILRRSKLIFDPLVVKQMLVHQPLELFGQESYEPVIENYNQWTSDKEFKSVSSEESRLGNRVVYVSNETALLMHMRREKRVSSDDEICNPNKTWIPDDRFYKVFADRLLPRVEHSVRHLEKKRIL